MISLAPGAAMGPKAGKKAPLRIREATPLEAYAHLLASVHDAASLREALDQMQGDPRLTPTEKDGLRAAASQQVSAGV